jgi:hypothetical protein
VAGSKINREQSYQESTINNSPTMKRVAKCQQTKQKFKVSAGWTRLQQRKNNEPTSCQRSAEEERKLVAERAKNKVAGKWWADESRPDAQQVISAEALEWPGKHRGSSRNPWRGEGFRSRRKHAGQVAALYFRYLLVNVGEAGSSLVARLGKGGVGGFAEELHGARAEPPQGLR